MAEDFLYVVEDEDQAPLSLSSGDPGAGVFCGTFTPAPDPEA